MGAVTDCAKADTPQSKAVCSDPELAKLDRETTAASARLESQLSSAGAGEVRQDSRQWRAWLQKVCSATDRNACLKDKYSDELSLLQNEPVRVGGMTFFARLKVAAKPSHEKSQPDSVHPEFATGRFEWPEIDRPTPLQAKWNSAVRKAAEIDSTDITDAEVDLRFTIETANDRLISVALENSRFDFGAAHPNEGTIWFKWWLQLGREIKAEDVFGPAARAFLEERCFEALFAGEHAEDLYDKDMVRKGVADSVMQVNGWMLDPKSFVINFGEYSVAPRVAGDISVKLNWSELKPYLAPGFDPASLPEPSEHPAK
jgi:uncharacterized protein